jgi:hypothetical protein
MTNQVELFKRRELMPRLFESPVKKDFPLERPDLPQ